MVDAELDESRVTEENSPTFSKASAGPGRRSKPIGTINNTLNRNFSSTTIMIMTIIISAMYTKLLRTKFTPFY